MIKKLRTSEISTSVPERDSVILATESAINFTKMAQVVG
jgi:hypothetical protein